MTMTMTMTQHLVDVYKDGDGRVVEWNVTTAQEQLALLMNDEVFMKASPEVAFDMVITYPPFQ